MKKPKKKMRKFYKEICKHKTRKANPDWQPPTTTPYTDGHYEMRT